jgi:hypothetical protein
LSRAGFCSPDDHASRLGKQTLNTTLKETFYYKKSIFVFTQKLSYSLWECLWIGFSHGMDGSRSDFLDKNPSFFKKFSMISLDSRTPNFWKLVLHACNVCACTSWQHENVDRFQYSAPQGSSRFIP